MWAQLIKMRLKPGKEAELPGLFDELQSAEQPGSGLLRTTAMVDQKDPGCVYTLIVFESEEKARAREQDAGRAEALATVQAMMADLFEGPPEFVDLNVIREVSR